MSYSCPGYVPKKGAIRPGWTYRGARHNTVKARQLQALIAKRKAKEGVAS